MVNQQAHQQDLAGRPFDTREPVHRRHGLPSHPPWRRMALCVDDFGLHSGINEAVLVLAGMGRVQAVSVMVGGAAWPDGARALHAIDTARLEVGLHLDLTECPLNPALRKPLSRLIGLAYLRRLDAVALHAEIAAQLDAFECAMGRAPAYVDGHQHVHQLPMVRSILLHELTRRYPKEMLWVRATNGPSRTAHSDAPQGFKGRMIALLGAHALAVLARKQGVSQNAHLLGVYDFSGGPARYRTLLADWLRAAQDGDLLMCHAGMRADVTDVIGGARQNEFDVLVSPEFGVALVEAQVRLVPMGQIVGRA